MDTIRIDSPRRHTFGIKNIGIEHIALPSQIFFRSVISLEGSDRSELKRIVTVEVRHEVGIDDNDRQLLSLL